METDKKVQVELDFGTDNVWQYKKKSSHPALREVEGCGVAII